MKIKTSFLPLLGAALCFAATLAFNTGCELNVNADDGGGDGGGGVVNPPPSTPPGSTNQPPSTNVTPTAGTYDQLNISGAVMFGPHARIKPSGARVTRGGLYKADKDGDHVRISFDPLNWPQQSSKGKSIDARCFIFWYQGTQLVGGMFDWHAVGQTYKTLGNVYHGYLSGQQPPKGATIWFCLTNIAGTERTFVTKSKTTW